MQYLFRVFKVDNKEQIGIGNEELMFRETYDFMPLVPQIKTMLYIPEDYQHYRVLDVSYSYNNPMMLLDIFVTQEDEDE